MRALSRVVKFGAEKGSQNELGFTQSLLGNATIAH